MSTEDISDGETTLYDTVMVGVCLYMQLSKSIECTRVTKRKLWTLSGNDTPI